MSLSPTCYLPTSQQVSFLVCSPIMGQFKPPITRTDSRKLYIPAGNRCICMTVLTCSDKSQILRPIRWKWPELRWLLGVSSFVQPVYSLPPLIQEEQLMALVALSCQWSRARLCACSLGFFYGEEAQEWSLPPLLSDSFWEGKVWCIGGDREAARTRSGVEREFDSLRFRPPKDQVLPFRLRLSASSNPHIPLHRQRFTAQRRTNHRWRCLATRARRTSPASQWVSGCF